MKRNESDLIWEAYDERFERDLNALRASLEQGKQGIVLADLLKDNPEEVVDDSVPVAVSFKMLQRPLIKELEDGSRIPNFVSHWSLGPGEGITKVAHGMSIQHALKYDSPVSSAVDGIGPETNVPRTIQYVIVNVDRDEKYGEEFEHKQAMNRSAAADATRWNHD
jgi:hypothetical protein